VSPTSPVPPTGPDYPRLTDYHRPGEVPKPDPVRVELTMKVTNLTTGEVKTFETAPLVAEHPYGEAEYGIAYPEATYTDAEAAYMALRHPTMLFRRGRPYFTLSLRLRAESTAHDAHLFTNDRATRPGGHTMNLTDPDYDGNPTLFDAALDPHTHARTTDPDTSSAAARRLSDKRTMMRRLLRAFEAGDSTAEEVAARCGYTAADGAWKRVSDLRNAGWVEDTGHRRPGSSGRQQMVLAITDAGRDQLNKPVGAS